MSQYIECPQIYIPKEKETCSFKKEISIFLAGGITNCPDWQSEVSNHLMNFYKDKNVTILNPRRKNFVMTLAVEEEQINWEYHHLKKADIALFWFPKETLCPITLFEYGKWLEGTKKPVYVGCHDDYARKRDLIIQTGLSRPLVKIWRDLYSVCIWLEYHTELN